MNTTDTAPEGLTIHPRNIGRPDGQLPRKLRVKAKATDGPRLATPAEAVAYGWEHCIEQGWSITTARQCAVYCGQVFRAGKRVGQGLSDAGAEPMPSTRLAVEYHCYQQGAERGREAHRQAHPLA